MKNLLVSAAIVLWSMNLLAQTPVQFKYQTIVRGADGEALANQSVSLRLDILEGTSSGTSVFNETHAVTTGPQGLVNISVGSISDMSAVDWSSSTYFLQATLDGDVLGASQLLSVPYALYARSAETANSFDYTNLTSLPDTEGWDKDVTDDFDGDYNSLTNAPPVITAEQRSKLDNITVTSSVDLHQLESDVLANSAIDGFPGFGTVPGTALEGGTDIWSLSGNDVFYNTGKVGINVAESADFGSSQLYVGGGIRMQGINLFDGEAPTGLGHLFYVNDIGDGVLAYNSDAGLRLLSAQNIWTEVNTMDEMGFSTTDLFTANNVNIQASLSVGPDAAPGTELADVTINLVENNVRIFFDDTDDPAGGFPANDWELEANDRINGGANYFAINDVTAGTQPFRVDAGAPENAFVIASNGNVGLGSGEPSVGLEVTGNVKAASFIGDGSGLTGITGATGGVSNAESTTIAADTDMNGTGEIALQTAGVTRVTIANGGNVGIGASVPTSTLDVNGSTATIELEVSGNTNLQGAVIFDVFDDGQTASTTLDVDVTGRKIMTYNPANAETITISGFQAGVLGQEISVVNLGAGQVTLNHNGAGTQKIFLPGSANASLPANGSATLIYDGSVWLCLGLNN